MAARSRIKAKVAVSVLCATLLYFGVYALVVIPTPLDIMTGLPPWSRVTRYRVGGKGPEFLFYPANKIDQKLFPQRWLYTAKDAHFPGS